MITSDLMITYLANIIKISQLDGSLHPGQQEVIGKICQQLDAEENDLAEAIEAVANGGHILTPVGRFSDKIRNLEDMLLVAMIDGELNPSEKDEILAFVKKISLTRDQVRTMLSETRVKIDLQQATVKCARCDAALTPESKFCTACGCKVGD